MLKRAIIITILLLLGCSDYQISKISEIPEPGITAPEIDVDPAYHDFGALSSGSETQNVIVNVKNIGNGDLSITDIYLDSGNSNFTITYIPASILEPLEYGEIIISYEPTTYESNSDTLNILSNDEDEPVVIVLLDGSGDAPVITVTPSEYDFGSVFLGCESPLEIIVGNIGNSNLIISDLEYFASLPSDFSLQEYESEFGPLPIVIPPGDDISFDVDYIPLDMLDDSAYIEITSNDPATPVAYADQDGLGDYESWVTESFTQDGEVAVDILFVIDNSGSMSSNQTNLKNNFGDFIAVFGTAGVDYHIALITTDDSSFVGSIITSSSADPISDFNDQVDLIGYRGSPYEKGLWYAHEATSSGGDASSGSSTGFFRSYSKLVIVYVSDEPDGSHLTYGSGGSTSMVTSDYSSHLLSLKSSPDLVTAHAVAGDYPSGCSTNGGAQFGDGYYDVVSDLSGTFMSICASDWSVTMDTLARESMSTMSYLLSGTPIEGTIEVLVNGSISTDWVYDSSSNIVTLTVAPEDEDDIDISYANWGCN